MGGFPVCHYIRVHCSSWGAFLYVIIYVCIVVHGGLSCISLYTCALLFMGGFPVYHYIRVHSSSWGAFLYIIIYVCIVVHGGLSCISLYTCAL